MPSIQRLLPVAGALLLSLVTVACGKAKDLVAEPVKPAAKLEFGYRLDDTLRLNQIQMKGTHNSYHQRPADPIDQWDYEHVSLTKQLEDQGVRQFELDIHYKKDVDRFAVYHLPSDDKTSCYWLQDCLKELLAWSDAHRGHHPLIVLVEPKDDAEAYADRTIGHYDKLDQDILDVWPAERVIRPDDIKGDSKTVAEGLKKNGWPTLGDSRGKILFALLDRNIEKDGAHYDYTHELKDLNGRTMFVASEPGDPYAAVMLLDGPIRDFEAIGNAVKAGFLVRTYPGDPIENGKALSFAEVNAARDSGAHALSSDHPAPTDEVPGYFVDLTGGTPSRCNPLNAPANCKSEDVESPKHLQPR